MVVPTTLVARTLVQEMGDTDLNPSSTWRASNQHLPPLSRQCPDHQVICFSGWEAHSNPLLKLYHNVEENLKSAGPERKNNRAPDSAV